MFDYVNSLTETLSNMGNSVIILFVIVIVTIVLSLAFLGLRRLNRMIDENGADDVRSVGQDDRGG
jgi:hypothetical protein